MPRLLLAPILFILCAVLPAAAGAMDTKAAGRCVALGALSQSYEAKAAALLAAASASGERPLVEQRVREEFAYLSSIKNDKAAKDAWTFAAVEACGRF